MSTYYCNHCTRIVDRDSDKRWIRSWCTASGRITRLWKVMSP